LGYYEHAVMSHCFRTAWYK